MREPMTMSAAEGEFRVDEEHPRAGVALLAVHGDADLHAAPALRERLTRVIEDGPALVVLDLSDTGFVDSMALGVLLGGMKRLRAQGGELRLVAPGANVRRIFEITLLDRIFVLADTCADALAATEPDEG